MNYSQTNTISSEIASDAPLSAGTLAYLEARAKNTFYDYILTKFKEAEKNGFTRAKLARRLGKRPDLISKLLGAPGNWTLGTVAELLVGIGKEELLPHSQSFLGRPSRNLRSEDLLGDGAGKWGGHPLPTPASTIPLAGVGHQWSNP